MKTVVVACGVGFASSTIMGERLKSLFEQEGMEDEIRLIQCTLNEVPGYLDSADVILTSSPMEGDFPIPVLSGVPFISGIGMEELKEQVLDILRQ